MTDRTYAYISKETDNGTVYQIFDTIDRSTILGVCVHLSHLTTLIDVLNKPTVEHIDADDIINELFEVE